MPIIKKHQNNTDFVCQHFGTLESIFRLAELNGISITENPVPGTELISQVDKSQVVNYYITTGLNIASDELQPLEIPVINGGIGYMKIINPAMPQSNDFIVS